MAGDFFVKMKKKLKEEQWEKYQRQKKKEKNLSRFTKTFLLCLAAGFLITLVFMVRWSFNPLRPFSGVSTSFSVLSNPFRLLLIDLDVKLKLKGAYFLELKNGKMILFKIPLTLLLRSNQGFFPLAQGIDEKKDWVYGLADYFGFLPNGYISVKTDSLDFWPNFWQSEGTFKLVRIMELIIRQNLSASGNFLDLGKIIWQLPKSDPLVIKDLGVLEIYQKPDENNGQALVLEKPDVLDNFIKVQFAQTFAPNEFRSSALIYNISGAEGLARQAARFLENLDITVLETANRGPCQRAPFCENQLIIYKQLPKELLDYLEKVFKTRAIERFGQEGRGEIEVLVGNL